MAMRYGARVEDFLEQVTPQEFTELWAGLVYEDLLIRPDLEMDPEDVPDTTLTAQASEAKAKALYGN